MEIFFLPFPFCLSSQLNHNCFLEMGFATFDMSGRCFLQDLDFYYRRAFSAKQVEGESREFCCLMLFDV
jgi:hypothetical protein